jgi:mono/diheme cytochrome c family protein
LRADGKWIQTGGYSQSQGGGVTAAEYNDTWKKWGGGLTKRPERFDEMYTLRYGSNSTQYPNPYPIPKADGTLEDPNAPGVNGGSGRLPIDKVQGKDANGKWNGMILNVGCASCHAGQVGIPGEHPVAGAWWGIPNNNVDGLASQLDSDPNSPTAAADQLTSTLDGLGVLSGPRGLNDASTGYELLAFVLTDWDSNDVAPDPSKHPPLHGRAWQDSPSWFHQGHQARKFKSGEVSVNAHRMTAAACAGPSGILGSGAATSAYRDYCGQRLAAYHESIEAPHWPQELDPIDTQLAEQGAVLFHTKNLWKEPGNKDRDKPAGNGSCAGCHGAYAPRYVNDPTFLATPELEGMASYIVPMKIIGAEPYRQNMTGTDFADTWNQSWWSYPEGQPGYIAPSEKTPALEKADDNRAWAALGLEPKGACEWSKMAEPGYLAPSLYGIWATGPYMHNGSVPTIGQMLDSSTRPTIWRRKLQTIGPVTGFDQSFATGYDFDRIGWKHDELKCEDYPNDPRLGCNPVDPEEGPPLFTVVQDLMQEKVLWTGTVHTQYLSNPDLRFVYDTRHTGGGNEGHEFTDVLTDAERKAIIEYLKTL